MPFVLCCLILTGAANPTAPHDLPDGVVKVATQVVVQPDSTQLRYDVGFNPTTLDQLVKTYAPDATEKEPAEKLEEFRKAFKEKIADSLKVKVDGKIVPPIDVSYESDEAGKHIQARFSLNFETLVSEETKIEVLDSCLQDMSRVWSSGFKAKLPVAIKDCSTKAIPLRSKPEEKAAGESEPFVITGTVVRLNIQVDQEGQISKAPLFVLFFALGGGGLAGLLMVPNEPADDHHDDHH